MVPSWCLQRGAAGNRQRTAAQPGSSAPAGPRAPRRVPTQQQASPQGRTRRHGASAVMRSQLNGLQRPIMEELVRTVYIAETLLPTRQGKYRLRGYKHSIDGGKTFVEPTAIICGDVEGKEDVVLRVHDACFTSEVLGSLKCDCAEQLHTAMDFIQDNPPGIVIYLWQEGRGIGLANKIAAYKLQEQGLDTVDANRALGLPDDIREYTSVRNILRELGVKSVKLMTNNPRKMSVLTELGVAVTGRISIEITAGDHNRDYLQAKAQRMEHMIDRRFFSRSASSADGGEHTREVVEHPPPVPPTPGSDPSSGGKQNEQRL